MTLYELPDVVEGMEPDEAGRVLDKVYAQVVQDAQHPYTNSHSPLHAKWVRAVHRLHEIHAQREPSPTVFDEALAEQAAAREAAEQESEDEA